MKNTSSNANSRRLFAIALVAVIGLSLAACDNGSTGDVGLNGTWRNSSGIQCTVRGNSATLDSVGTSALWQSALSKGYTRIGQEYWRNIRRTGSTWSGEGLTAIYNSNSTTIATRVEWSGRTFSLSADGNSLTVRNTDTGNSGTYTRR